MRHMNQCLIFIFMVFLSANSSLFACDGYRIDYSGNVKRLITNLEKHHATMTATVKTEVRESLEWNIKQCVKHCDDDDFALCNEAAIKLEKLR